MKNFWSLQVGEAIVADEIKNQLSKNYQVFIPLNNQLKDVDLVLANINKRKHKTIQVKESRDYIFGSGFGWFTVGVDKLNEENHAVDFYIFLQYTTESTKTKFKHKCKYLIVPTKILKKYSQGKKTVGNKYHYYFHFTDDKVYETRDRKNDPADFTKYEGNFKLLEF